MECGGDDAIGWKAVSHWDWGGHRNWLELARGASGSWEAPTPTRTDPDEVPLGQPDPKTPLLSTVPRTPETPIRVASPTKSRNRSTDDVDEEVKFSKDTLMDDREMSQEVQGSKRKL